MPIFGFVLTLAADPAASGALEVLTRQPELTLGALAGRRLPVVLDLDANGQPETYVARWLALPGVLHVDYAFADFDDLVNDAREKEGFTS